VTFPETIIVPIWNEKLSLQSFVVSESTSRAG